MADSGIHESQGNSCVPFLNVDPQNPINAYYLHPGENPGAILVSPPLEGGNYHSWSRAMRRALSSKNKLKFVDGSIRVPSPIDPHFDIWERCNNMVVSWITRSLSPKIAESTVYIDNAQDLWKDLRERFSKGNYFKMSNLLQEIHSIKQGERDVSGYFTTLKIIWEELESLRPTPSCTCEIQCRCNLLKSIKDHRESEYVICFLKGLNDQFQTTKSQILLMEPLPSINKVFSLVTQAENQLDTTQNNETRLLSNRRDNDNWRNTTGKDNAMIQRSQDDNWRTTSGRSTNSYQRGRGRLGGKGYNQRFSSTRICTYYNKGGHIIDTCYHKHGFPPNYTKIKENEGAVNNLMETKQFENTKQQPALQFNPEQYALLTNLLQQAEVNSTNKGQHNVNQFSHKNTGENTTPSDDPNHISGNILSWILDSGATDHVSPFISNFDILRPIKHVRIKLPNGSSLIAKQSGTVTLSA
ncbi:PREDICTED: uncharacterized protein LOC109330868 [Lupinus angustifolius]|uniref:uncharacterized protein LOC109330868 n=1 Tax=Lupinus angustifolius TaxID=3871 RepID=UPI00092EAFD6|nr:PREDICTED: uncharacterized protein LOC109330868 [Lupinus angustifolius]